MKSLKLLFVLVLFASAIFGQQIKVTFRVHAKNVGEAEKVYITGNHELLGNWRPNIAELKKKPNDIWEKTFSFPKGSSLQFKFTKGSFQQEAINDDETIPGNSYLLIQKDTIFEISINKWKDEVIIRRAASGQITGEVKYHPNLEFEGILPRDVIVWLPPEYEQNSNQRYPVLYMHDGQNIIDPMTSSFGIDWLVDEAADSLIKKGEIEPIIIVGVYNTSDRSADYSPGLKGTQYMKFLVEKVKPLIDKTYRTKPDRENTAVAGSSMGGLISMMVIWNYPDIFSKAGCYSPAFKYSNFDYPQMIIETAAPDNEIFLYIDNGGIGLEQELQPGVDKMIEQLKRRDYVEGKDFVYVKAPEAEHNEPAWAKRFPYMLKLFYGK